MGKPPFGDVHLAKDFKPGDKRRVKALGRSDQVLENAVQSVPYSELPVVRLNVDIACSVAHRLREDEVHHLNHRGFARHLLEICKIGVFVNRRVGPLVRRKAGEDGLNKALFKLLADQ